MRDYEQLLCIINGVQDFGIANGMGDIVSNEELAKALSEQGCIIVKTTPNVRRKRYSKIPVINVTDFGVAEKMKSEERYKEIIKLYKYCQKIGVHAVISPMFNGYCILFKNGGDVIQHDGSYGRDCGCVEFAIGSRSDYKATSLNNAKALINRHKDKLNSKKGGGDNA